MTRSKKMIVLLAITAVLAVAAVLVLRADFNAEVPTSDEEFSIFTSDTSAVTAISRIYDGINLTFEKNGESWRYTGGNAYTVDPQYVTDMLGKIADITTSKQITGVTELAQYSLDKPELTVTITEPEGNRTLYFAGEAALTGRKYLNTGDGNVYLVDQNILDPFELGLLDMIQKDEIPALDGLSSINIENPKARFTMIKNTADAGGDGNETETEAYTWSVEGVNLAVDNGKSDALANYIIGFSWQQCVSFNAGTEELSGYGLADPAAVITSEYGGGKSFKIYIGNASGESYYAKTDSNLVYLIKADAAERLLTAVPEELTTDIEE